VIAVLATEAYVLRLFVTGSTARSAQAVGNMRRICDEHLAGRHELQVVDIYEHPEAARASQVIAAPTLVRLQPGPIRRIVGDLSDSDKVLTMLGLAASLNKEAGAAEPQ
jgi:circadian clock protein KaiB